MQPKEKKYLIKAMVILIAIILGFGLFQFMNPYSHFIEVFEKHKFLQRCAQDKRALAFLNKGGEYFPDYENPRTLNDKISYIFRNYFQKSPLTKYFVNKYFAKKYISDIVGEEHVAKLIEVWKNPEDIEWDKLPNQFVLKATHGCGGQQVILVKDKSMVNIPEITKKLANFCHHHEMKEMGVTKERIIAEEYLELPNGRTISDYKIFCSYGKAIFAYCLTNPVNETCKVNNKTCSFYSVPEWNRFPVLIDKDKPNSIPKPKHFAKMMELAVKLSKPFPLIRVDFYEVGDRIIVGELTEDPCCGRYLFSPLIWDFKFGEMINVPSLNEIEKIIERDKKICELQEVSEI